MLYSKCISSFTSNVPAGGLQWITPSERWRDWSRPDESPQEGHQRHLVPAGEWEKVTWKETWPLRDAPALVRQFADLEPDDELAIRDFANEHGQPRPREQWRGVREPAGNPTFGLNHADWAEMIKPVKWAVALWEVICREDVATLSEWIELREGVLYCQEPEIGSVVKLLKLYDERLSPPPNTGDPLIAAASALVKDIGNSCMSQRHVGFQLEHGKTPDRMIQHLVPKTLFGAMWIQFASWTLGERDFSRCAQCNSWFAKSRHTKRAHAVYCRESCRSKAHRSR